MGTASFRGVAPGIYPVNADVAHRLLYFLVAIDKKLYYSYNTDINCITQGIRLKESDDAMISFDDFNQEGGGPIYLQILLHIKRGIVAGSICDGDELPSRRVLSALLGVNPNTIQKAYRVLEEEQLVSSRSGAKSYMMLDEAKTEQVRGQLLKSDTLNVVTAMKQMGISRAEALSLIEKYWE